MSDARENRPVTRLEILDLVEECFERPPVTADELRVAARDHGARPEVVDVLDRLEGLRFRRPVELWSHLPELPIDH